MTVLVDGNMLIALTVEDHIHHRQSREWFETNEEQLATCPITQGTLLRFLLREGLTQMEALGALQQIEALPHHVFWPDEIPYDETVLAGVVGHRQVTDGYLVALALHFGGVLVTLDRGLGALHPKTAEVVPT